MKKKFILMLILTLILIYVFALSACGSSDQKQSREGNIYEFEKYENSEILDIEKIALSPDFAKKCTTYKFNFMSDSVKVKAYISIPVSHVNSDKPGKCILFCRGGNSDLGQLDESWTSNICTACGRISVAAEYRGTPGVQGEDQFGGEELNDIIKLIDLCEKHFEFIDMDDFCVAGVSRGGMMTYMSARRDNRIKRIISVSGVSDLFLAYEERDDMKQVLKNHIGYTPQENPEEYEKRSATYWADEIRIPVLVIHCKKDQMVSYNQAEIMYEKLKDHTDCTFISHDDDTHGPHPEDLITIKEWLEK